MRLYSKLRDGSRGEWSENALEVVVQVWVVFSDVESDVNDREVYT
jgi:hypothetical protein